jgi:hypothetical protein
MNRQGFAKQKTLLSPKKDKFCRKYCKLHGCLTVGYRKQMNAVSGLFS